MVTLYRKKYYGTELPEFNNTHSPQAASQLGLSAENEKMKIQIFHGCGDAGACTLGVGAGVSLCLSAWFVCVSVC
jgi:pyruvate/2-oxoacid:ferredoxin oxidoreductase beta subunit